MGPDSRFAWLLLNWFTRIGAGIGAVSAVALVLAMLADAVGLLKSPPLKAWAMIAGPGLVVLGVVLVITGLFWERWKRRRRGEARPDVTARLQQTLRLFFPDILARRRAVGAGFLAAGVLGVLAVAGLQSTSYMETSEFCGRACHASMAPQYHAYLESAHSRVPCVRCHVGSGVKANIEAKLAGLRQVVGTLTDRFERPIPTPVETLRPSRETCEKCHWPAKFKGNNLKLLTHYQSDATSSPRVNVLLIKEGGFHPRTNRSRGIHWHVSPDGQVRYVPLDRQRKRIGRIQRYDRGKLTGEWLPKGGKKGDRAERVMDCVDCHNRPSHIFDANAAAAVDRAIEEGRLDPKVPWARHVAVTVLEGATDIPRAQVWEVMRARMEAAYRKLHPEVKLTETQLEGLARGLGDAYLHNVYPVMKLRFGTYESFIGHGGVPEGSKGCFRCHDDEHVDSKGKALGRDCGLCHDLMHIEEKPSGLPENLRALLPFPAE